jgi:hypothetical protein
MRLGKLLVWSLAAAVPLLIVAQQLEKLTVVLKNRDVRSVAARVAEELGPSGQVWVDGAKNQVTVEDDPARLNQVRQLLTELDVPARRFAVSAQLDVLPKPDQKNIFRPSPQFVDMTAWAESVLPTASYTCMLDVREGGRATGNLGRAYRLETKAQGYDPTRHRLAFESFSLLALDAAGKAGAPVLQGAAVLPVGVPTVLLVNPTEQTPPLRLRATPQLAPTVKLPEAR